MVWEKIKMAFRVGALFITFTTLLSPVLGALTLSVDATPSNYGTTETLKCLDPSYISGNGYFWEKNSSLIFNNAGEISTIGKYSESIDELMTFKLVINDINVSDEGNYTCSHNFGYSDPLDLKVESRGNVTAELSSSKHLEVTFQQIYPSTISASVTCGSNILSGNFEDAVSEGDRYIRTWKSDDTFSTLPTSCSTSVTLRTTFNTTFTITSANQTTATTPTTTTNSTSTTKISTTTTQPTSTTSSSNESTVIIVSSVLGGLFLIGIVITIVLMLLSHRRGHHPARNHRHHDLEGRHKRRNHHQYPSWQDHGKYNNASYMEFTGMGTKINPLYTVPYRSAHRAEQSYYLGHPSTDHQNYPKSQRISYERHYNNVRSQTDMHSNQPMYYGGRGCNNIISSTLHRDENNYVAPDYELYW